MQFTKQSFMGIELDILVGHPEHDILFIATQVARAAGLQNAASSVNLARKHYKSGHDLAALIQDSCISLPVDALGRKVRTTTVLFTERETYEMLARGNAPQSQPFRDWVFGEVLPSIRKKGSYNVNDSTTKEGMQFSGELAALQDVIRALLREETSDIRTMLKELMERPVGVSDATPAQFEKSPYEKDKPCSLGDGGFLFDLKALKKAGEVLGYSATTVHKLIGPSKLAMEKELTKLWSTEDGRALEFHFSGSNIRWTYWPKEWAKGKLDHGFYKHVLSGVADKLLSSI